MALGALLLAAALTIPGEMPLGKPGIAISNAVEEWPAIASDGDGYLVVWTSDAGVLASRYRPGGEMIDIDPIVISTQPHLRPRVTWIGSGYLVTFLNRFALVDSGGAVVRDGVLPFPPEDPKLFENAVIWDGRCVMVATTTASLAVYDANLRLVHDPLPRSSDTFAIVGTEKGFVVLRQGGYTTTATPVSDAGVVSGADVAIPDGTYAAGSSGQRIALFQIRLGARSVTILDSELRIIAKKAWPFAQTAASQAIQLPPPISASERVVVASDQGFLFAQNDTVNGFGDVHLVRITADGDLIDTKLIDTSLGLTLNATRSLHAASNGRRYLVVWNDGRRGSYYDFTDGQAQVGIGMDVWGADVPAAGPVRTLPIVLGPAAQTQPVAAFNGRIGLVAWAESTTDVAAQRIVGARISATGAVLDETPFQIALGGKPTAMASDGDGFLVVWSGDDGYPGTVRATMVRGDGTILTTYALSEARVYQSAQSVAFDGENYFVVWQNHDDHTAGARIRRDGQLLDPVPFDFGSDTWPSIAFDGIRFWIPTRTGEARPFNRDGFPAGWPVGFGADWQRPDNVFVPAYFISSIGCRSNRCAVAVLRKDEPSLGIVVFDANFVPDVVPHGAIVAPPVAFSFPTETTAVAADENGFYVTASGGYPANQGHGIVVSRDGTISGIDAVTVPLFPYDWPVVLQPFTTTEGRRAVVYSRSIVPLTSLRWQPRVFLRFVAQPRRRSALK